MEIAGRLARMEEKLDELLVTVRDHEGRIRWAERIAWLALGAGVISGGERLFT